MKDPRRALGREDDIRVDAQLPPDGAAQNGPLAVTFQVQNLTRDWIAIADRVVDVSYDGEERTITMSVGAEVPAATLPHIVLIAPGDKKTFTAVGMVHVATPSGRGRFTPVPRYVQIRVNVLRNVAPFRDAIARQSATAQPVALADDLFDKWVESNDSIFLNTVPVEWKTNSGIDMRADKPMPDEHSGGNW